MGNQKGGKIKKSVTKKGQKRDQISLKFFKDLPEYNQLQLHYHFQKLSSTKYVHYRAPTSSLEGLNCKCNEAIYKLRTIRRGQMKSTKSLHNYDWQL